VSCLFFCEKRLGTFLVKQTQAFGTLDAARRCFPSTLIVPSVRGLEDRDHRVCVHFAVVDLSRSATPPLPSLSGTHRAVHS
jgi:hypothetical protein